MRMVSYLAKVSEGSGAVRLVTRDPLCAEKRARWTRTRATGLSCAHGKPPRLTGGGILGEMCENSLRPTQRSRASQRQLMWNLVFQPCYASWLPRCLFAETWNSFL